MAKEFEEFQRVGEGFQNLGKGGFDVAVKSFGEVNRGLQAITAEVTNYSKKTFEDGTRAFEQLLGDIAVVARHHDREPHVVRVE